MGTLQFAKAVQHLCQAVCHSIQIRNVLYNLWNISAHLRPSDTCVYGIWDFFTISHLPQSWLYKLHLHHNSYTHHFREAWIGQISSTEIQLKSLSWMQCVKLSFCLLSRVLHYHSHFHLYVIGIILCVLLTQPSMPHVIVAAQESYSAVMMAVG